MSLITDALRRPSQRTLMEAEMTGLVVMILASLAGSIYLNFFTDTTLWIRIPAGLGELGILVFMFSNLATKYLQYYAYKTAMNLYPTDVKLLMRIKEAKSLAKILFKEAKSLETNLLKEKEVKNNA